MEKPIAYSGYLSSPISIKAVPKRAIIRAEYPKILFLFKLMVEIRKTNIELLFKTLPIEISTFVFQNPFE
jgi:hypothetical protein